MKEVITKTKYTCDGCGFETEDEREILGQNITFPVFDTTESGKIIGYQYDRTIDLCNKCCCKLNSLFKFMEE